MRAIVFDKPGDESVLRLDEVAPPELRAGEVRVRVHATAVNRADLLQRRGLYPPPPGASPLLGLEGAGEVVEAAPEVHGLLPGTRVMALLAGGGYAEEACVDAGSLLPLPAAWSFEAGAAFMETALASFLNLFLLGEATRGSTVLVHGGGSGVGTASLALCREAGVRVLVTVGSADKAARCLALGASAAIDYKRSDFAKEAQRLTDGRGVDVVLDCIGGSYLAQNLACLASEGRLVVIGLMGGAKGELDLGLLLQKRAKLVGSTLRGKSARDKAALVSAFAQRFGPALAEGRLAPVVHAVLPLAEAAEAHRLVLSSQHFGKVVLRVR